MAASENNLSADGAVGVPKASEFVGLSRTSLYDLMTAGELKYIKIGNRRLIPRAELVRLLNDNLVGINR